MLLTEKEIASHSIPFVERPHLYFLLKGDEVTYVGSCSKSTPNLFSHNDKDFDCYYMLSVEQDVDLNVLLAEYIIKLVPKHNGNLQSNEKYMSKSQIKKKFNMSGYDINKVIKEKKINTVYLDYYDIDEFFQ
ncbi:hypothetical protein [Brevibacillus sp. SIMBA_040]|uniref:hypothetical protein n=1 Tax=unclassified Brevibacillus TaxID=2684853 RepID=UPI00397A96CA